MVSRDDEEDWKVLMLDWSGRITYMTMAVHCNTLTDYCTDVTQ